MQTARDMLRRFGLIGVMLMVLGTFAQPALAAPCEAPADSTDIVSRIDAVAPAGDPCADDCEDCALACAHGCCHVHAGALIGGVSASLPAFRFGPAAPWSPLLTPPGDECTGPERPPRA